METVRSIAVTVDIDTNKRTVHRTVHVDSAGDAAEAVQTIMDEVLG